ncbi:MAG: hypothetical protein ACM3U0_02225 [archaeon]
MIDILGSMIIGGLFLLILLRFNENTAQNSYSYNGEVIVQENLVSAIETLEYDLRKIGYCEDPYNLPKPSKAILYADSSKIKYLSDTGLSGKLDTVMYCLTSGARPGVTPNSNVSILCRSVNGETQSMNPGVTQFRLKYFDAMGIELTPPLTAPTKIVYMQIDVKVESIAAYDNVRKSAFWRQIKLTSRNI